MRRWLPALLGGSLGLGVLGILLLGVAGAGGSGGPLLAGLLVGVVALAAGRRLLHRGAVPDLAWSGGRSAPSGSGPGVGAGADPDRAGTEPAGLPPTPLGPDGRSRGSVALSLARVEARELSASAWFGLGIGFWLLILVVLGLVNEDEVERGWPALFALMPMLAHPFSGMMVVAAHRSRTRGRRDGCEELFATCPADAGSRSLGLLLTAWLPAAVSAACGTVLCSMVASGNPRLFGPLGPEAVAAMLACAVLAAGAVALGVALGRWAPWPLAPVVAVVGVGLVSGRLNAIGGPSWSSDRLLATFVAVPDVDLVFVSRPVWAQLGWFVGLTVVVGSLALVGDRRRAATVVGTAAIGVAVVSAWFVVRPVSPAEARRIADLVTEPESHQTCVGAGPDVRVCAFTPYGEVARLVADDLRPVAAAVPSEARRPVVLRQRHDRPAGHLAAEVAAVVADRAEAPPAADLRLRFHLHPENLGAARLRLAAHVIGLPTETVDGAPTVVAGQARGVVALWLAAQGLDERSAAAVLADGGHDGPGTADATEIGSIWPGSCHDEEGVLVWAPQDLQAARALVAAPYRPLARAIGDRWELVTDPSTTTDDLLVVLGLEPVGPPSTVEARPLRCG